jgi:hypothetical protein
MRQQRIVLPAPAQDLDDAFDLGLATDQRIDLALHCQHVEVLGELVERGLPLFLLAVGLVGFGLGAGALLRGVLGDAVRDEIHHVEAGDALLVQVIHRVRILLAEDRDHDVRAGHFLLAVGGGLHVHHRALDDPLETERGLRVDLVGARHDRRVVVDEMRQILPQIVDVGRTGAQDRGGRGVVEQCQQQMLDGDEFVTGLSGLDERHVQTDFQFLRDHASSITHCSGC